MKKGSDSKKPELESMIEVRIQGGAIGLGIIYNKGRGI